MIKEINGQISAEYLLLVGSLMVVIILAIVFVANNQEADKMDQQVKIGDEVSLITTDSSKADLKKGDTCTWRQLFYGLLLPSGNDAALAIAKNIGRAASGDRELGTDKAIDKFVSLMNRKAIQLQLEDSHFCESAWTARCQSLYDGG